MTFPVKSITGVEAVDDLIASYLQAPTMLEFFIGLGTKEASERTNSLHGQLFHALASRAKVMFKVRGDCGFFTEFAANIVASFPRKFRISRECNCSNNWHDAHTCPTQSDNWGHCNCTYSGGCQKLCDTETACLRPKKKPFFGQWKVKYL